MSKPRRPKGESGPASSGAFSAGGGQDPFAAFASFGGLNAASSSTPVAAPSVAIGAEVPAEFKQVFKRLTKRDMTTRVAACEELTQLLESCAEADAIAVARDVFTYVRRRHGSQDKHLRRALCFALRALFSRDKSVKKHLVKHLPIVLGPWLCLRFDTEADVLHAARQSWEVAFDSDERSAAAFSMCTAKLVAVLRTLLETTVETLKDEDNLKPEEAISVLEGTHSAALRACAHLLQLAAKFEKLSSCTAIMTEELVESHMLWQLGESAYPTIRTEVYNLISMYLEHGRESILMHSRELNLFMQNSFGERAAVVHPAMWPAMLRWLKHNPEGVQGVKNPHSTLFQKLYSLLRKTSGIFGSDVTYQALLPMLVLMGTDVFINFNSFAVFADQLLGSIWMGLQSSTLPMSEFQRLIECWAEVWRFLAGKAVELSGGDQAMCAFLVKNHLAPVLRIALLTSFKLQQGAASAKLGTCLVKALTMPVYHTAVAEVWTSLCEELTSLPADPKDLVLSLESSLVPVGDGTPVVAGGGSKKKAKKGSSTPEAPAQCLAYFEFVGAEEELDTENTFRRLALLLEKVKATLATLKTQPDEQILSELYLLLGTCFASKLTGEGYGNVHVVSAWKHCDWSLPSPKRLLADFYQQSGVKKALFEQICMKNEDPAFHQICTVIAAFLNVNDTESAEVVRSVVSLDHACPEKAATFFSHLTITPTSATEDALCTSAISSVPTSPLLTLRIVGLMKGNLKTGFATELLNSVLAEIKTKSESNEVFLKILAEIGAGEEKWGEVMQAMFEALLGVSLGTPFVDSFEHNGDESSDEEARHEEEEDDEMSESEGIRDAFMKQVLAFPTAAKAFNLLSLWCKTVGTSTTVDTAFDTLEARLATFATEPSTLSSTIFAYAASLPCFKEKAKTLFASGLSSACKALTALQKEEENVSKISSVITAVAATMHTHNDFVQTFSHVSAAPSNTTVWRQLLEFLFATQLFAVQTSFNVALMENLVWTKYGGFAASFSDRFFQNAGAFVETTQLKAVNKAALKAEVFPMFYETNFLSSAYLVTKLLQDDSRVATTAAMCTTLTSETEATQLTEMFLRLINSNCGSIRLWSLAADEQQDVEDWCRTILAKDEVGDELSNEEVITCLTLAPAAGSDLSEEVTETLKECVHERYDEGDECTDETPASLATRISLLLTLLEGTRPVGATSIASFGKLAATLQQVTPYLSTSWVVPDGAQTRVLEFCARRVSLILTEVLFSTKADPENEGAECLAADVSTRAMLFAYVVDSLVHFIDVCVADDTATTHLHDMCNVVSVFCSGADSTRKALIAVLPPAFFDALLTRFVAEAERTLNDEPSAAHELIMGLTIALCDTTCLDFSFLNDTTKNKQLLEKTAAFIASTEDTEEEGEASYRSMCGAQEIPLFVQYCVAVLSEVVAYPKSASPPSSPTSGLSNSLFARRNQAQYSIKALLDVQKQIVHGAFPDSVSVESLIFRGRLRIAYFLGIFVANFVASSDVFKQETSKKHLFSRFLSTNNILKPLMDCVTAALLLHKKAVGYTLNTKNSYILLRDSRTAGVNNEYRESVLSMFQTGSVGLPRQNFVQNFAEHQKYLAKFDTTGEFALSSIALLYRIMKAIPASPRRWVNDCENTFQDLYKNFVQAYLSPSLIQQELQAVINKGGGKSTFEPTEELTVKVHKAAASVLLSYDYQDTCVNVKMTVPPAFPLDPIEHPSLDAQVTRAKAGLKEQKWRRWLMQMTAQLLNKSASLWDCVELWSRNLEKHFAGQDACPICYQVVNTTTQQLPSMECSCCHGKYHKLCLYKWFKQSNNSTCPLCRSAWYSGMGGDAPSDAGGGQ